VHWQILHTETAATENKTVAGNRPDLCQCRHAHAPSHVQSRQRRRVCVEWTPAGTPAH